jgi:diguanylate cyclase (GGDEF)-like protein
MIVMSLRQGFLFFSILICVVLAVVVNFSYGIEIVYTHLFYIPIILTGIWYPRYAILIAVIMGLLHITVDYATIKEFKIAPYLRTVMFVVVAYVTQSLVTEREQLEYKLKAMSITDDLTGLYNRRGFFTVAAQQMNVAERSKKEMLLFSADLDNMKQINDTFGHQEGDCALIEIASILKEVFRKSDIICRMGGDEFAVLAIDTTNTTREVLMKRLDTILEACNRRQGSKYQLSMSVGVVHYDPGNPSSIDELMAQADVLMYEEKRKKKNYASLMNTFLR